MLNSIRNYVKNYDWKDFWKRVDWWWGYKKSKEIRGKVFDKKDILPVIALLSLGVLLIFLMRLILRYLYGT